MKNKIITISILFCCCVLTAQSQQLKLSSYPSATAVIYLDFDGEEVLTPMWNNGEPIHCLPAALTNGQIFEVFSRVAEDYRPFDINITTDLDVFNAAPFDKRIRVIITPTSSWFANVGGVSYLRSFTWGDDTPCFVFSDKLGPNNPKMLAECCSHESGHALGLSHQSRYDEGCHLAATYHEGTGSGETAWAPIMGNSYYRNMSGWSNGPTPYGCGNNQDNLSILTTQNGFGYRVDDHSDDISNQPTQVSISNINITGLINTPIDKDAFMFSLQHNSIFHLDALPFNTGGTNDGANLDIKLSLYDAAKNLVQVYNPATGMGAAIDTILNAGNYYVVVEGTGNMNTTDYGSLGSYTLSGLYSVMPICNIALSGTTQKNVHQLNWFIDCNEVISEVMLQASTDAIHFDDISNVTGSLSYNNILFQNTDMYYRLQVTTRSGNSKYSSTALLKKPAGDKEFIVSTFITGNASIMAPANFKYQLLDINGNRIMAGNGTAGYNTVNMQNKPSGTYILVLSGCGETRTIRVLKL